MYIILKKCKKPDDILFINASEHFEKGKRLNRLRDGENGEPNDIQKIVDTYQFRREEPRYSRRVPMEEIEKNGYNLNITRYVSTSVSKVPVDLKVVHEELGSIEKRFKDEVENHDKFLIELGLPTVFQGNP